ncbi:MAG: hypothetical protein WD178_05335, partial [Actinomycetota bacterium]
LWTDHAIWTREYVVAAIAGSPDTGAAAGRLLRNQEDIGNAVVPLYGQDAGAALTDLLKQHILIAVDLVAAALAGDKEQFASRTKSGTATRWTSQSSWATPTPTGTNVTCTTFSPSTSN